MVGDINMDNNEARESNERIVLASLDFMCTSGTPGDGWYFTPQEVQKVARDAKKIDISEGDVAEILNDHRYRTNFVLKASINIRNGETVIGLAEGYRTNPLMAEELRKIARPELYKDNNPKED